MSRTKHTRPAKIIAADRVRSPRGKRTDEARFTAQAKFFQDLEIDPEKSPRKHLVPLLFR